MNTETKRMRRNWTPHTQLAVMQNGASIMENSSSKKKRPYYLMIQQFYFWGIYAKIIGKQGAEEIFESKVLKKYLYKRAHSSIIHNTQKR